MNPHRPADFSNAYQYCHIFVIFSLPHSSSPSHFLSLFLFLPCLGTLYPFFFCGREHKTRRLLSGQRGAEEERREIERKAQEEEGGCELSNRIKGEQRNGEHLKYSWHEPSCKKEGMSNNGWITLEALSLHIMLSRSFYLSLSCHLCLSFTLLLSSPLCLIFYLLARGFDGSQRSHVNNVRESGLN